MSLPFTKYQATGNDFILIDNRLGNCSLSPDQVKKLCDRRLGIGADGIILIEKHPVEQFNLVYYNNDGSQSLCGNGSRAAVQFAARLGLVKRSASFHAFDGAHTAEVLPDDTIRIKLNDVAQVTPVGSDWFINTGSPHVIRFVTDVKNYPVAEEGKKIRYSQVFAGQGGTNANFVELLPDNTIFVRTYERGVENETLSCGTGVTAAALAAAAKGYTSPVKVKTLGGNLSVEFTPHPQNGSFTGIYLTGPAKKVFEGVVEL